MAMVTHINMLLLPLSLLSVIPQSTHALTYLTSDCSSPTISISNSEYQTSLQIVSRYLTSNAANDSFFYTTGSGSGQTAAYGLFLCRGDLTNATLCSDCVATASKDLLTTRCPSSADQIIWYYECMVRFSTKPFLLGKLDLLPVKVFSVGQNVSESEIVDFKKKLKDLLYNLPDEAAEDTQLRRKFATKVVSVSSWPPNLYGLAQCTPDLTTENCTRCLQTAIRQLPISNGGGVFVPSCYVGYASNALFNGIVSVFSPPPPGSVLPPPSTTRIPSPQPKGSRDTKLIIIIIVVAVTTIILVALLKISLCWHFKRMKASKKFGHQISSIDSLEFDLSTIKAATDNFSPANKLGQGGFGAVYKGILPTGQEIAVKRLLGNNTRQGEVEFKNEILLLARLQHKNLVRLLGFCLERGERLLAYEYVPNASLDHFLFDSSIPEHLDWERRNKIIGGIVRGLLYLHEDSRLKIIHRDLKASNILLDEGMNPKIADFGLAKLFMVDQTSARTSQIAGTYGYMAPEYARYGLFSVRSDVYSFGILLLEIICGRKNGGHYGEENAAGLVSIVWRKWREGTILSIVDPTISFGPFSESEIKRYIHIALLCVQENAADRPTVSSIALMLSNQILPLPSPSNPGFIVTSSSAIRKPENHTSQTNSCKSTTSSSVNNDTISELFPR